MLLLKCAEKAHSKMSLAKNGKIAKMLCKMSKTLLSHWHMKICSDLLKNCPKVPGFLRFQSRAMILSKRMRVIDALPPLTEWDSRSLQQKMVGGFSSQPRWIHSHVRADLWLAELQAFASRSAVSINRCIDSCTAQSRLHVCWWFNNLSLCRK